MDDEDFRSIIQGGTKRVYKTKAEQCKECKGFGKVRKVKKDGTPYSRDNNCKDCDSLGFNLVDTQDVAGLKFKPPTPKWASANGFSTSKDNLTFLESVAKSKGLTDAVDFLSKVRRLSAVDTYLSSFIEGITNHTKPDGMLHVRLIQQNTATGRLSGAEPNMQNMPRGSTFPVKKVFVSRFDGGKILEADMAQLEFRTAAYLSQDGVAIEEVKTGFDVHSYTAKVISDAGEPTSRQDAKAHTFAPLYGATGFGRTRAQARYYEHFTEKYQGIKLWHTRLAKEAVNTNKIRTPSGREFSFPDVTRRSNGTVTHFTQIKNYPVQSFATADIVPLCLLHIEKSLDSMKSCVVNSVHDSIVIDVHPEEEKQVLWIIQSTNKELPNLMSLRWGINFNVPLLLESKIGNNWLDTKDVI
jgi:DNA polymerase I-like protein with 3'-5' exonuclease and polymerase domains